MIRARFYANADDFRPIKFPPPYPYWCSGYGDNHSIVIAFADSVEQICEYWPEADEIEHTEAKEVTFSDRFPKPDWWPPPQNQRGQRRKA